MSLPPPPPPDLAAAQNGPLPFAGAPVRGWPEGAPAPELPAGAAGISVRVRKRATDSRGIGMPRMVAVDDRLMWIGIGRAVVATTPGTHYVEVRDDKAESVRRVDVRAGEIAEFDFWTPASRRLDGVLVRGPARSRPGAGAVTVFIVMPFLILAGVLAAALPDDTRRLAVIFGCIAAGVVLAAAHALAKGFVDRRARVQASYEADEPPSAEGASFLGDAPPPGPPSDGSGLLVLTTTLQRSYGELLTWTASGGIDETETWIPWPMLTIDGRVLPCTWRTWAYRLTPGRHELVLTVYAPPGSGLPARPARRTVEVGAGEVVSLSASVGTTVHMADAMRYGRPAKRVAGFAGGVVFDPRE